MRSAHPEIHPSNASQLAAWDGDEGAYWAAHADRFDRVVAGHDQRLLQAAAIARADRVLDIGCGAGLTTRAAARLAPQGRALGIDLSARLLEHARRTAAAEGVGNAEFEQADAQIHPFGAAAFDVAISRTGTMFFGDPVAAFANIARALAPGGRLAMLTWQPLAENEWLRELFTALAAGRELPPPPPDAPGPFALADPARVRHVLHRAGFTDIQLASSEADLWFGDDPDETVEFVLGVLGWLLDGADDATQARAYANLRAAAAAHHGAAGVTFGSAGWIITGTRP